MKTTSLTQKSNKSTQVLIPKKITPKEQLISFAPEQETNKQNNLTSLSCTFKYSPLEKTDILQMTEKAKKVFGQARVVTKTKQRSTTHYFSGQDEQGDFSSYALNIRPEKKHYEVSASLLLATSRHDSREFLTQLTNLLLKDARRKTTKNPEIKLLHRKTGSKEVSFAVEYQRKEKK